MSFSCCCRSTSFLSSPLLSFSSSFTLVHHHTLYATYFALTGSLSSLFCSVSLPPFHWLSLRRVVHCFLFAVNCLTDWLFVDFRLNAHQSGSAGVLLLCIALFSGFFLFGSNLASSCTWYSFWLFAKVAKVPPFSSHFEPFWELSRMLLLLLLLTSKSSSSARRAGN